ncbi:MAG: hypothetical protein ABL931_08205 [Usitatibacteraceae bacterium]
MRAGRPFFRLALLDVTALSFDFRPRTLCCRFVLILLRALGLSAVRVLAWHEITVAARRRLSIVAGELLSFQFVLTEFDIDLSLLFFCRFLGAHFILKSLLFADAAGLDLGCTARLSLLVFDAFAFGTLTALLLLVLPVTCRREKRQNDGDHPGNGGTKESNHGASTN